MRKTFKLFCAAVVATLAVSSCGKMFDEIDTRLDSIETRLTELEAALNTDVANLATLDATHKALDKAVKDLEAALKAADATSAADIKALQESVAALQAQLAGVKVESKNGTVVVTIGENSFTLSKNGVLTIVEVEGVKYWALVDPATGEATNLNVKVGHDIKFKVDPETAEVLICYDGDKYVGTGVYAAEGADTLIGDVEETDDYVTITIGDATYQLQKWADDKSVLGLSRADFFLMYGATKVVELTAEDIAEYYVMAKPDGWKASFEGKTLTVIAPAKKTYEVGAAEAEGEILIHATTVEGKCKVAKLDVKTGDGLTLKIDSKGNLTIDNAFVGINGNDEIGFTEGFMDFAFGLAPADEFLAMASDYEEFFGTSDPYEGFEKAYSSMGWAPVGFEMRFYNWYGFEDAAKSYEEGKYEVDHIEVSVLDVYKNNMAYMVGGGPLPYGSYVVWAVSEDANGTVGGMRFAEFNYVNIEVELMQAYHNDLKVSVSVAGADEYLVGWMSESQFNQTGVGPLSFSADSFASLDKYMLGAQGPWSIFQKYGAPYMMSPQFGSPMPAEYAPMMFPEEGALLSSFDYFGEKLQINETYYLWVMPMFNHMMKYDPMMDSYDFSAYDYEKHFKPYVFVFKTNDVVAGSSVAVTLGEVETGFSYINVPYTAEGAEKVYYHFFTNDEFNELSSDSEIVAAVFEKCEWPMDMEEGVIEQGYLKHGESRVLAVVALDAEGKYSAVVTKTYKTETVDVNQATVKLVSLTISEDEEYTAVLNVEGATKVFAITSTVNEKADQEAVAIKNHETQILSSNLWGLVEADVVDGKATITFDTWGDEDLYVWGYNVDEEGNVVDLQATPSVFNLEENLHAEEE